MSAIIKRASESDLHVIADVLREAAAWLASKGMPMWRGETLALKNLAADIQNFYVAYEEDRPTGVVMLKTVDLEFWPDITKGESLFLHRLAIRRTFCGGKTSGMLLDFARAEAARMGMRYVRLDCAADRPKLRKIYEDYGFRHHSDRVVGSFAVARYEYILTSNSAAD